MLKIHNFKGEIPNILSPTPTKKKLFLIFEKENIMFFFCLALEKLLYKVKTNILAYLFLNAPFKKSALIFW